MSKLVAAVLVSVLCLGILPVHAEPPVSKAFLEEHHVASGTSYTMGAAYIVPSGRRATVTGFFCEIRNGYPEGSSQIVVVAQPARDSNTVRGPLTPTLGMNPLNCVSTNNYRMYQQSGSSLRLGAGDMLYVVYANFAAQEIFAMLSAWIYEEDDN